MDNKIVAPDFVKRNSYPFPRLKPEHRANINDPWTPSQKAKEETAHMKRLFKHEDEEEETND